MKLQMGSLMIVTMMAFQMCQMLMIVRMMAFQMCQMFDGGNSGDAGGDDNGTFGSNDDGFKVVSAFDYLLTYLEESPLEAKKRS